MMLSVLVLGASTLALQAARQTRQPLADQRTTEQRMDRIEKALKAYWLMHQCNQLPATAAGLPSAPAPEVPWRELGLQADDRLDAWGRLITYRQAAAGLTVSGTAARWALVSHGPSGLGGWLPSGSQKLPLPAAGNVQETANVQSATTLFQLPGFAPADIDPASATNHFDDMVRFGDDDEWADMCPSPPPPPAPPPSPLAGTINLDASVLKPPLISFVRRGSGKNSVAIAAGAVGNLTVSSSGGDISANSLSAATAIGVCSSRCAGRRRAALSGSESLSFKLDPGQTAGKVAIGLLGTTRRVTSVGVTLEFKRLGVTVAGPTVLSASTSRTLPTSPQLSDVLPSPSLPFDEVVIQPVGSALLFVSSIRFCASSVTCT